MLASSEAGPQLEVFRRVEDERPSSRHPLRNACALPLKLARRHAFEVQGNGLASPRASQPLHASARCSISPRASHGAAAFEQGLHRHVVFAADTASELKAWLAQIRRQILLADASAASTAEACAATRLAACWRGHVARRNCAARRAALALIAPVALAEAERQRLQAPASPCPRHGRRKSGARHGPAAPLQALHPSSVNMHAMASGVGHSQGGAVPAKAAQAARER